MPKEIPKNPGGRPAKYDKHDVLLWVKIPLKIALKLDRLARQSGGLTASGRPRVSRAQIARQFIIAAVTPKEE